MSLIQKYLEGLTSCLGGLSKQNIEEICNIIFDAYKNEKQVFIMGNGGSASTASHFARDLSIGTAAEARRRFRAESLTDNVALITALANDIDYSSIFAEQLIGRLNQGDVVIAISASGNSPNVLKAVELARKEGAITIGLTGFNGGKLKHLTQNNIIVCSQNYGIVEDTHLCLAHIISHIVRERIANGS